MDIVIQLIGFIGTALIIWSFQHNTNKRIIWFQILSGIVFTLHFSLLLAWPGAVNNLLGVLRNCVWVNREKKWADGIKWLWISIFVFLISGYLTFLFTSDDLWYIPAIGMVFGSVALYIKNPKYTRLISLFGSFFWITYNILCGSIAGVATEIFVIGSIFYAMYRFKDYKLKKGE